MQHGASGVEHGAVGGDLVAVFGAESSAQEESGEAVSVPLSFLLALPRPETTTDSGAMAAAMDAASRTSPRWMVRRGSDGSAA
jgi:hypothetical protein